MAIILTDAFTGTTIDSAKWNAAALGTAYTLSGTTTQNNNLKDESSFRRSTDKVR